MSSVSIISPEKRIEVNPYDVDAWNLLLRESQARPIDQARTFYERLVTQFPNAGRYWKAYIEHEIRGKNFDKVEALFSRCLVYVLNIDLWKCYIHYVKEAKGGLSSFREKMAQAFDFALDKVGLDMHSYSLYSDYIQFLKTVPALGQYAENQRITAVRKIYQRGTATPIANVEILWSDYCTYEKSINQQLAEKLIAEKNKDYQASKKMAKELETTTRGINRNAVSVPSRGSAQEMKQVEMWRAYINWEKSNPMELDDYALFAKRVVYAYEQALLCLGYYPDIWYEAGRFLQEASKVLIQKGDVKMQALITAEAIQLFERATNGLMRESQLIHFAYCDFEEERMKFDNVRAIFDKLLALDHLDPTLTYIQLMKFTRRTEGVQKARLVFKRAREDPQTRHHVYVAAALMEYYCSKNQEVAMRVFDLGLKKYGDEPEFAAAYVDFLAHLNEDNNTRVVFERILTSGTMTPENQGEIWDRYLDFEGLVGDLASTTKIEQRRRESGAVDSDILTNTSIDRYKFMSLVPCSLDQLRYMGYVKPLRGYATTTSGGSGTTGSAGGGTRNANAPQAASVMMGGGAVEMGGYPKPDTDQMIPFKPKANAVGSSHPVPGGVFPPPPVVSHLLTILPPPWTFHGPFVNVDSLLESLSKYQPPQIASSSNDPRKMENGTMLGPMRVEDVKKELYQMLASTTDPSVALLTSDFSSSGGSGKRKRGADSDSEDETTGVRSNKHQNNDIYKRRMHQK